MRKILTKIFFSLGCFTTFTANAIDIETCLKTGTGYRQDSLNWSIAGENNHPNILSELKWENLEIWEIRASAEALLCKHIYFKGEGDYGKIYNGRNRDSDYLLDHRRLEYSRAITKADRGEVFDFLVGFGYQFSLFYKKFFITPLAGYSYHEQHLQMHNGFQKISIFKQLGKIKGLHSNYRGKWSSPWLGFDASYLLDCKLKLKGGFEYHWAHYHGTGHWNLRDFPRDFQHVGNGYGLVGTLECDYQFCNHWILGFLFKYQDWRMHHGCDHTYLTASSGSSYDRVSTRLNVVNWHSFSVTLNAGYHF